MTNSCKHKPAAASINWFVNLLKGKGGHDRTEALAALSKMLQKMKTDNCDSCSARADCHDLDNAIQAVLEQHKVDVGPQGPVGPLLIKKEHARKQRLTRPRGI